MSRCKVLSLFFVISNLLILFSTKNLIGGEIHRAIQEQDLSYFQELLKSYSMDAYTLDEDNRTILHWAILTKQSQILQSTTSFQVDPYMKDNNGETMLDIAQRITADDDAIRTHINTYINQYNIWLLSKEALEKEFKDLLDELDSLGDVLAKENFPKAWEAIPPYQLFIQGQELITYLQHRSTSLKETISHLDQAQVPCAMPPVETPLQITLSAENHTDAYSSADLQMHLMLALKGGALGQFIIGKEGISSDNSELFETESLTHSIVGIDDPVALVTIEIYRYINQLNSTDPFINLVVLFFQVKQYKIFSSIFSSFLQSLDTNDAQLLREFYSASFKAPEKPIILQDFQQKLSDLQSLTAKFINFFELVYNDDIRKNYHPSIKPDPVSFQLLTEYNPLDHAKFLSDTFINNRNLYMVEQTLHLSCRALKESKSLFLVVGYHHAKGMEILLKKIFADRAVISVRNSSSAGQHFLLTQSEASLDQILSEEFPLFPKNDQTILNTLLTHGKGYLHNHLVKPFNLFNPLEILTLPKL